MNKSNISANLKRRIYFFVMVAFFFGTKVGFTQDIPDAPSVTVGTFPTAEPWVKSEWARSKKSGAAPVAAKAPLIDPQIADSSYWAATASLAGTTVANVELTARCQQEGTCLTWINPGKGSDRARLYAYTIPSNFALDYLAYKLKGKTRLWILPQMAFTAANLFSAGRSYGRIEISGWFAQKAASSRLRLESGKP